MELTQHIQEYRAEKVDSPLPNGKEKVKIPDAEGVKHELDPDDVIELSKLGADFKDAAEDRYDELLEAVMAAETHGELNAIDVDRGWPE
ncbi:hypothetical protein [Halorhodospira sp. 9622]|uniref:hypothetical protein n=1 Tax=Halorhodospira sp. 9622 TaxID=2899136 RepID=UPI001EE9A22C|nr:hypothetical protein [Halorhodospira sp. 9622]MCG5538940.1 hypothetical protein [Halorhodospira sp. 9622]